MYLYLSVFMISSHLGVIHVAKRIRTFSIWGGVDFEVRNWGGIDAGPQKWGGMVTHSQKWGGPTCGRRPRDSAHPPLSVFLAPSLNPNFQLLNDNKLASCASSKHKLNIREGAKNTLRGECPESRGLRP